MARSAPNRSPAGEPRPTGLGITGSSPNQNTNRNHIARKPLPEPQRYQSNSGPVSPVTTWDTRSLRSISPVSMMSRSPISTSPYPAALRTSRTGVDPRTDWRPRSVSAPPVPEVPHAIPLPRITSQHLQDHVPPRIPPAAKSLEPRGRSDHASHRTDPSPTKPLKRIYPNVDGYFEPELSLYNDKPVQHVPGGAYWEGGIYMGHLETPESLVYEGNHEQKNPPIREGRRQDRHHGGHKHVRRDRRVRDVEREAGQQASRPRQNKRASSRSVGCSRSLAWLAVIGVLMIAIIIIVLVATRK